MSENKLFITAPNATEWRDVPILDHHDTEIGRELRPYSKASGEPACWAVQRGSQELFLNTKTFEVLYTGNRGGGKTACLLMDFAQHVGRGYGADWKGILFRHAHPELKDVIDKGNAIFREIWGKGVTFDKSKSIFTWDTGEQLLLRHMDRESDYDKYHGHAYPWMGWEELTTWADPGCYTRMMSCCRSANPLVPRKVRSTTNPYGPGFAWVKMRFQLPLPPGKMYGPLIEEDARGLKGADGRPLPPSERRAINSDLRENKVLLKAEPNYVQRIAAAARNDAELGAWLRGDWDIVAGGMFDDLWLMGRDHIVVPAFEVPDDWRIDLSFDWGSSRPFAVGWWAESNGTDLVFPDGTRMSTVRGDLFRIGEWYGWDGKTPNVGLRMLAKDIAAGIVERTIRWGWQGRVRRGIADASIFDVQNGNCIARDMEKSVEVDGKRYRGVYFDAADKGRGSREQGWEQIRKRMQASIPGDGPREEPGIFVCKRCTQFLRTIPTLPRDDKYIDDVDTDAEDHIADEVRYRVRKKKRQVRGGRTKGMN